MRFHKLEEFLRTQTGRKLLGTGEGSADFANLVRDSQKFYAGNVSRIESISFPESMPPLPYQLCTFEFQSEDDYGRERTFFLLCEELGDSENPYSAIRMHVFVDMRIAADTNCFWLHYGWVDGCRITNTGDSFLNKRVLEFLDSSDGCDKIAGVKELKDTLVPCANYLARFLSVLNCSNVKVAEVEEPKALNKKRERKGKVPIYSYKTLVLKTRQQAVSNGNGSHESPRIHLRRGHIKRRKTGDFWWQPCVVGDRKKGIVVKDYRADGLL